MTEVVYIFEWDERKARANAVKHGVTFRQASAVFRDPLALTLYEGSHSDNEDRWVTLGQTANATILVVVHTWHQRNVTECAIRIISARAAVKKEIHDYQEQPR